MSMPLFVGKVTIAAAAFLVTFALVRQGPAAQGVLITPAGVIATSEFGDGDTFGNQDGVCDAAEEAAGQCGAVFVTSLIDGSGLSDPNATPGDERDDVHDNDGGAATMWHAGHLDAGIPGGEDPVFLDPPTVDAQIVEFDLGAKVKLTGALVWQMNQGGAFGAQAPRRSVDEFEILISPDATSPFASLGTFNLPTSLGSPDLPATAFDVESALTDGIQRVRFDINTIHTPDPAPDPPHPLEEFVGLSEVRFEAALAGDANLDGAVTASGDGAILLANLGPGGTNPQGEKLWADADFNFDRNVDAANDGATLLAGLPTDRAGGTAVPEPSSLVVAILAGLLASAAAVTCRRRNS